MISQDYRDILSIFIENKIEFLVVGAHALAAHGVPRATGDLDIWVSTARANADKVHRSLKDFGAPLQDLSIHDLTVPGTVFQIGVVPNRIDILTAIDAVSFKDAWADRSTVMLDGLVVPVIGRKHLILNKRTVGRPQDIVDVQKLEKPHSR